MSSTNNKQIEISINDAIFNALCKAAEKHGVTVEEYTTQIVSQRFATPLPYIQPEAPQNETEEAEPFYSPIRFSPNFDLLPNINPSLPDNDSLG